MHYNVLYMTIRDFIINHYIHSLFERVITLVINYVSCCVQHALCYIPLCYFNNAHKHNVKCTNKLHIIYVYCRILKSTAYYTASSSELGQRSAFTCIPVN